jgi:hypothetical protein
MLIPLIVASPDILATALSTAIVAFSARELTRIFLAILSLSYYIRGFGVLLTALQGFFPILLVSETVRAGSCASSNSPHCSGIFSWLGEKEIG